MSSRVSALAIVLFLAACAAAQTGNLVGADISDAAKAEVFDKALARITAKYFDPKFNGVSIDALRAEFRPRALAARDKFELERVLIELTRRFGLSHLQVWFNPVIRKKELAAFSNGQRFDGRSSAIAIGYGFQVRKMGGEFLVSEVQQNSPAIETGG